jgi:erythromycin esterase
VKKKKSLLKSVLPFLVVGGIIAGFYSISPKKVKIEPNELKNKLIALKTVQAGNGFEDLGPLKEILKDKQIIAMGDATYGTKESIQMKHRMFEFLVEEMGYRVLGIEADFAAVQVANDYILNGVGNAIDVSKAINSSEWYAKEIADLVEWMRKYNEDPNNKTSVKLYGFVLGGTYEDKKMVLNYLKKVDESIFKEFKEKLRNLLVLKELDIDKVNIEKLRNIFGINKKEFIEKTSKDEFEIVSQCLEIISQRIEYDIKMRASDVLGAQKLVENAIANNVKWILDYESKLGNDKIALWADNLQVNKSNGQYESMGEHLKNSFNEKYYSIAFEFYNGTFMAYPCDSKGNIVGEIKKFTLGKSIEDSISGIFEKTEIPLSFMDFKSASQEKNIKKWLSVVQKIHSSEVYDGIEEHLYRFEIPMKSYDGLIFVKESSASKELK